jgi:chromate reductase
MNKMKIIGISGSLRHNSYNTALLRAAQGLMPDEAELEIVEIKDLPLYNEDLEANLPAAVVAFKEQVKTAEAIIFASPEYNYSFSGVLKNALDWASRPYGQNSFDNKPALIVGASMGNIATARMQYQLRQVLVGLNVQTLNHPEVLIGSVQNKISADGQITDDDTGAKLKEALTALIAWTKKLSA